MCRENDNEYIAALFIAGVVIGAVAAVYIGGGLIASLLSGSISGPILGAGAALKLQGK